MTERYISKIATHWEEHLDERGLYWLFRKFKTASERHLPGITTATMEYWDAGTNTPNGKPITWFENRGYHFIGVGGGAGDEHQSAEAERKHGECAFSLHVKMLGLEDDPRLNVITQYILDEDLKGNKKTEFDFAAIVKVLNDYFFWKGRDTWQHISQWVAVGLEAKYREQPRPSDKFSIQHIALLIEKHLGAKTAKDWLKFGVDAKLFEQQRFFNETAKEFESLVADGELTRELINYNGKLVQLVCVMSDNRLMGRYIKSYYGGGYDILVQEASTGHIQIYAGFENVNLDRVAQMLNIKEQERLFGEVVQSSWDVLTEEGTPVFETNEERILSPWFYFKKRLNNSNGKKGLMILNGSKTTRTVRPTVLGSRRVREIIKLAGQFEIWAELWLYPGLLRTWCEQAFSFCKIPGFLLW